MAKSSVREKSDTLWEYPPTGRRFPRYCDAIRESVPYFKSLPVFILGKKISAYMRSFLIFAGMMCGD